MNNPTYTINDVVYLKESAARGFLEAVRISSINLGQSGWIYTVNFNASRPINSPTYGDRIVFNQGAAVYYTESEFVNHCQALSLALAYHQAAVNKLSAQLEALCSG
jgi:hypothetical protein